MRGSTSRLASLDAFRGFTPFVIYGMNALFIFALPIGPVNTSLLHALLFNACMFAVAWGTWRKKWFVKV
jgi:predicted acyltransferase